jgi:hypothetical protein
MTEKLGERADGLRAAGRTTQRAHVEDCSNYDAAMIRGLSTLLLLAVLGAAFAGCGSKSSAGTTTVTSNPSATRSAATPKQQVALCQRAVERLKTLPGASKTRLRGSCEKYGTGETGRRQVVHEVCYELALRLPTPLARVRAQKICSAP